MLAQAFPSRAALIGLALAAMLVGAWGCSPRVGGSMSPDDALNDLRRENLQLKDQIAQMERKIDLRIAEIDSLKQELNAGDGAAAGARNRPRPVALKFARYTGGIDVDNDGRDDLIRIYLQPVDQQGRVLPVAAEVTVTLAQISDGHARVLTTKSWTSAELDGAYRSGLTGTYYTLETPLPADVPRDVDLIAKATLVEGDSGVTLSQQAPFKIK